MKLEDLPSGKLYYSIGEVAELFQVNTSLIRFWEKEFEVLKPGKNKKGNRLFTVQDIENLKEIYHLVKEKGFTLQGAREYLKSSRKSKTPVLEFPENKDVKHSLEIIRKMLMEIRKEI
ncbi:MAG: MerR family transcriptional regulator [Bacteroidales bacterium]